MLQSIGAILLIIGYALIGLATICGVGYGLWLLGPGGVTFGMAAWGGFTLFLKMIIAGFVSLVLGFIGVSKGE